jgi:hypothetical protein
MSEDERKRNAFYLGAIGLAIGFWILFALGCSPFATAAKVTLGARAAADAIDQGMAVQTNKVVDDCLKKHESKSNGYAECVKAWKVHLDRWRKVAAPALSASITAAYYAIKLAKEAGQEPKAIMAHIVTAACGVVRALKQFGPLLPAEWKAQAEGALTLAEGMICK